jgi:hypothetical protein
MDCAIGMGLSFVFRGFFTGSHRSEQRGINGKQYHATPRDATVIQENCAVGFQIAEKTGTARVIGAIRATGRRVAANRPARRKQSRLARPSARKISPRRRVERVVPRGTTVPAIAEVNSAI